VQDGHDDFDGRSVVLLVGVDGDAASVVPDAHRAVVVERDRDIVAVARERLVDGVVHDLVDEVVETPCVSRTDVHRRALPDRLQSFEHLYLPGSVLTCIWHEDMDCLVRPLV